MSATLRRGIVVGIVAVVLLATPATGTALGGAAPAPADAETGLTDDRSVANGTANATAAPDNAAGPEPGPDSDSPEIAAYDTQTGTWEYYEASGEPDPRGLPDVPTVPGGDYLDDIETPETGKDKVSVSARSDTGEYPWSAVGAVGYQQGSRERSFCSGAVISDRHVLTAAHCLLQDANGDSLDGKYEPDNSYIPLFYPGGSPDEKPFGAYNITYVQTYKKWFNGDPDTYDIAVLTLNESIGARTGTFGYEKYATHIGPDEYEADSHLTGYPRDSAGYVSEEFEQWNLTADGQGTDINYPFGNPCMGNNRCHQFATGDLLDEDSVDGLSGGPVWQPDEYGRPVILSVLKGPNIDEFDVISDQIGIRMLEPKQDAIEAMIEKGQQRETGGGETATSLILDRSGSMSGSSLATVKGGAKNYVGLSSDYHSISVVSYASGSRVDQSMTMLEDSRSDVTDAIDSIDAGGLTNVHAGLEDGLDELDDEPSADNKGAILLSDGYHNTGPSKTEILDDLVPEYNDRGYCLYTFAYGSGADDDFLEDIADTADCGRFFALPALAPADGSSAASDRGLADVYGEIRQDLVGSEAVESDTGTLQSGETATGSIDLRNGLAKATIRVRLTGAQSTSTPNPSTGPRNETAGASQPPLPTSDRPDAAAIAGNVTLVDPSGEVVTSNDAGIGTSVVEDTIIYRISTPEAGDWQYELTNSDASERSYEVSVTGQPVGQVDDLDVEVTATSGPVTVGESVDVQAQIRNTGQDTTTEGVVLFADGQRVTTTSVTADPQAASNVTLQWDTDGQTVGNVTVAVGTGVSGDTAEVTLACVPREDADRDTPDGGICDGQRDQNRGSDDRSRTDAEPGDGDRRDRGRGDDESSGGDRRGSSRGDGQRSGR